MKTATSGLSGLAWALALLCVGSAWADLAEPPEPPREITAKLRVRTTHDKQYRILIPEKLLNAPALKVGQWEAPADDAPGRRTLVAGLALSAAACSLVLVRKRSKSAQVLVAIALGGATYLGSQWAYADLAPRRPVRPPQADKIVIQVSPHVREVQLYVPAHRRAPVEQPGEGAAEPRRGSDGGSAPESRSPASPASPGRPPQP